MSALLAFLFAAPFLGYTPVGDLRVDESCGAKKACTADVATSWRHPTFAFATDAPLGVTLSGRMVLTCADGGERTVLLPSIPAGGGVGIAPNSCPDFAAKRARVVVESAAIPGGNAATIRIFAALS